MLLILNLKYTRTPVLATWSIRSKIERQRL